MTTAGTITVGVDIDGTGLGARLHNAISSQLAPVMAQLRSQTQATGNDFGDLARRAELSSARQVIALRRVEQQLHSVRNAALQAHAALNSLHGPGNNGIGPLGNGGNVTINRNTYDYRNYSVTNHTYNNSTTTIHNNNGGGGGGGGGNNNHGGGRGGGGSFLTSPGILTALSVGANALPAATLAVTNLLGAIQQLGQAGLALPGIFAGGIASVGTAVIGFQGMGDAVKAINKGLGEGASKADAKKMAAALKDMDDNAKAVALTIATDFIPEFKKAQSEVVQHNMFDGIATGLTGLKEKALPTFKSGLGEMSKAWNDTFKRVIGAAGDSKNLSLVDRIFGNSTEGQKRANQAIAPITRAMLELSSAGTEFLPRLGDGITKLATRFGDFVSKNVASGQMWKWIDEGLNGMRALGNSVLNIGKVLTGLTKTAGGDGGILGWLEKSTGKLQSFVNSPAGQAKLQAFFDGARESMRDWAPILKDVMRLVGDVITGFQNWGAVILPVIGGISHGLASMPGLVSAAVTAFAAFKTVKGLGGMLGFRGPGSGGPGGGGGLGGFIGSNKFGLGMLGLGGLALGTGLQQDPNAGTGQRVVGGLTSIASGALLGGTIGSILPGPGTAIGAGIGALAGGAIAIYNDAMGQSARAAQAAADAQKRLADAQEHAAATSDAARGNNLGINRALTNSGGKIDSSTVLGVADAISLIPDQLKDQLGSNAKDQVDRLVKGLNVRPDQLAEQVVGSQGVFDALVAQLGGQGSAGTNYAAALRGLRDRVLGQADTAAVGAPLLNAVAGNTGRTPDMVQADLQALIRAQGQGQGFNVNAPGGADLLKQLQGAGLPVSAGQGGAITGTLTPEQFKQLAAASGVPIINMPGNGIGIPAARPAGPNLQALPNPQQQNLLDLAAAAGGGVVPPAGGPPVPPIGPGLSGPVPVQIVGTPPGNANPLAGLASAAAGPAQPAAPAGPPPDIAQSLGVKDLTKAIEGIPPAKIDVQAPEIPKAQQDLKGIWDRISDVNKTPLKIDASTDPAKTKIDQLIAGYQSRTLTINVGVNPVASGNAPLGPPRADGGVLPGYSPGVDNMLVPMSGGEGVVIPEAMRALGGSWLYSINSRFRAGLSRRGYATGGVVGADGALGAPDNSVIGLLTQIRDALVGRGSSALATTADNTTTMAQALGPKAKPFGGDVGKGALAGAIRALGGDPNQMDWGGFNGDGQPLVPKGLSAGTGATLTGGGGNLPALAAALSAFARSGNVSDLSGSGLNVNSPVVTAITSARNKKTGLSDDAIAGLVQQVLTGGGYAGVLDSTNTPLVKSLTRFQQQQLTGKGGAVALPAAGGFDAALLSQVRPGQYSQTAAADLTKGLADCSSSVEDLVNLMDGMPTAGRELSTGNAAEWLPSRGFIPTTGVVPGAMNVAFNSGHMQATLPDGTPFNWGSDAAAARGGVGGTGAADPALTQRYYRPVTGLPLGGGLGPGMAANPLGYSGGPVPVYIVSGPGGGGGFGQQLGGQLFGDALTAAAPAVADAAGSIITGIDQGTQLARNSTKDRPAVRTGTLMKEGNPLSVAALAGYTVPDFTRQGWNGEVMTNGGPGFTAGGQMMSDTASLIMRTFTDTQAAADARQQQMLAVLDQIKTQLSESVLKPIIQSAVQSAMATAGQAAQQGASGGGGVIPGLADGGAIWGGTPGVDSVPLMGMPGEHMLTTRDVAAMGGQRGVYAFRAALHRNGGMRGFAGGGSIGNDTVGADWFGVSQVPIIGDIINLIMKILLKVIGVEIQVRDTMNRMSDEFRQFRGDFKAFDASGRLMNDTSGLVDRSGSSEEAVVAERVRIFKQVLEGLIKFIIQKIVIPITQAIASSLLQAGASAAGGAVSGGINTVAPGAGGIAGSLVTSLISSGGQAGINIGGEIAQMIAGAATGPIVGLLTDGFMGIFGKLLNPILTGGIGGLLSAFFPFLAFDDGGLANGVGLLPKATVEPERVLSPRQTSLFEEMVRANFTTGGDNSRRIDVSGGIHLYGADAKPEVVVDHLTKLLA